MPLVLDGAVLPAAFFPKHSEKTGWWKLLRVPSFPVPGSEGSREGHAEGSRLESLPVALA